MTDKKLTNIQTYRKKPHFNIGIAVFGIIFIYLIATVFLYMTDKHISVYEVREGSILKDTAYTGLAIRSEKVISAESTGYINYFSQEGSKVGAKTNVYTLSSKELDFKDSSSDNLAELTSEEQSALLLKAQSFSENFKDEQFRDVYTLKDNIQAVLESKSSESRQAQLDDMIDNNEAELQIYKAVADGIISYSVDGYERIKADDVTEDMITKKGYSVTTMKNNTQVKSGDPVYKLITEDTWTLVISLSDSAAKEMADLKRVKVRFSKDGESERADIEIHKTSKGTFAFLTFDTAMIRYIQERYLDIELILEDETGLKIPKSSVVKKQFYTVPKDYLTQGGNSKETGVLVDDKTGNATFQKVDVYYWEQESDMVYLDPLAFEKDTVLLKPESSDTYTLKQTKSLQGVYNINKGYAVFKQIEILCESEDYYIVKAGNAYSLANYDHIALDGKYVKENDVVF
ncbi:MAG: HlyD family efflux transporter periplasmic adaptor subunit [Lachnospiraceae bacterium]